MSAESRLKQVVVMGAFDDLRSRQIRFLEEAARFGEVTALLWTDDRVRQLEGRGPRFPEAERAYVLRAIRFVRQVIVVRKSEGRSPKAEPDVGMLVSTAREAGIEPDVVVVDEGQDSAAGRDGCEARGIGYRVVREEDLRGFPERALEEPATASSRKRVVVTGCYDWFHSGHVRFFEEVSGLGDLYVVVGHDANIKLLKGDGHPIFSQDERRYMVQSVRFVKGTLISSGQGWMDAEPEVAVVKPDIYAVNEDGDVPEKRAFCKEYGIEYVVLKRIPKEGLPKRQSTNLRGF